MIKTFRHVLAELRSHAPFTVSGAVLGMLMVLLFKQFVGGGGHMLFAIFHPLHVVLSAMVTAALYKVHRPAASFVVVLAVGYIGAVGIASLSDCVIPYVGERLLGLHVPSHGELHEHDAHEGHDEHEVAAANHDGHTEYTTDGEQTGHDGDVGHGNGGGSGVHLGFIEEWYLVNPAALLGVVIACFLPRTKFPHAAHVLISTWASAAHMLMNTAGVITAGAAAGMVAVLFLAVWLPCCVSDIVFPSLLLGDNGQGHEHDHAREGVHVEP